MNRISNGMFDARNQCATPLARASCLAMGVILFGGHGAVASPPSSGQDPDPGLTSIAGVLVGHHTLEERPTGCTVVLTERGAVAGVDVRGSAPGTREIGLLDPVHTVERVHAVVLSGGSAFGLDSASGVVRFLEEKGVGFDVRIAKVPIVPAAILFDLGVGGRPDIRPGPACGYEAAKRASADPVQRGNIGAGAGATVGKMAGSSRAMKSGIGSASIRLGNGLIVAALIAVNAVGDIIDPETGAVVAGILSEDGSELVDARRLVRSGALFRASQPANDLEQGHGQNTTIGVVVTNAKLTKTQATKVAQMAHDGLARAISPAHTPSDGDTLFALATGDWDEELSLGLIGALGAEVVSDAILDAVRSAEGLPGYPSLKDLQGR